MKREHEAQAIRAELAQIEHRGGGRAYPEKLRKRMIACIVRMPVLRGIDYVCRRAA